MLTAVMEEGRTVVDAALIIRLAYFSHGLFGRPFPFNRPLADAGALAKYHVDDDATREVPADRPFVLIDENCS